jgi:hypothetical protein
MMIRYCLFVLLCCNTIFAQKKISFDRMIEYEVVGEVNLKKRIFLSNSKDESCYCSVIFKDDGSCWLYLYYNYGYITTAVVQSSTFFEAETIIFPKQERKKQFEPIKYDVKRYDFTLMSDTLLDAKPHAMYGMKYSDTKEVKLYDRGQALYIVEPGTESYSSLPIFSSYFDVHVSSRVFPKGLATEMLYYNADNSKLQQKLKLILYGEIKPKYIVLPN